MPRILLIDNYDSFTYNIREYLGRLAGYQNVDLIKNDELFLDDMLAYDAWIISPGPGLPEESGSLITVLQQSAGRVPVLGICLGHQAIAEVYGARLINLGEVRHGRQVEVQWLAAGPLNDGLASRTKVGLYHSWAVEADSLPDTLEVLAKDDDGQIMAIRHKELPLMGVQFHPESILTPNGSAMIGNFLRWAQR